MRVHTTLNYSDVYPGPKPDKEALLTGIPSPSIILVLCAINAELASARDLNDVQLRMIQLITNRFPAGEKIDIIDSLKRLQEKTGSPPIVWARRYVLALMKFVFLHYHDLPDITLNVQHEINLFKAYLLIAEELNRQDGDAFNKMSTSLSLDRDYFFERLVWPFLIRQFDTNNHVSPPFEMIKLLSLVKYSQHHPELRESWLKFIAFNGFDSMGKYLGSVHSLIKITQHYNEKNGLFKSFTTINPIDLPDHLQNLSFDVVTFAQNSDKQIDYKGFREKPLFKNKDNGYIILDLDFMNNKIYNGPLFDMYSQTRMNEHTSFKSFPDFKSHLSTHVLENILLRGVLLKLFKGKDVQIHFDEDKNDGYPDCYIRKGNILVLIEFKDYLFPGKLVDEFSFEKIKSHIDDRFIKNKGGSNKGISQLVQQLKTLNTTKFPFDDFNEKNLVVFPVMIHTNFMYQLPGINTYLDNAFNQMLQTAVSHPVFQTRNLVLIDLSTLFEFLFLKKMNLKIFTNLLNRFNKILYNRERLFQNHANQENFVRARTSFDEIYWTILYKDSGDMRTKNTGNIFLDTIDATEEIYNNF